MSVVQLAANPAVCHSSTDPPGAALDWDGVGYLVLFVFTVSVSGKRNEQHAMSVIQLAAHSAVCRSSTDPPGAALDWDGVGYLVLFVFHSVGAW